VGDSGGREENEGSSGELNHQLQLPQDEVASLGRVKISSGLNGTPTEGNILNVAMLKRPDFGPKVESRTRKY
jgi:hypothetical protein